MGAETQIKICLYLGSWLFQFHLHDITSKQKPSNEMARTCELNSN